MLDSFVGLPLNNKNSISFSFSNLLKIFAYPVTIFEKTFILYYWQERFSLCMDDEEMEELMEFEVVFDAKDGVLRMIDCVMGWFVCLMQEKVKGKVLWCCGILVFGGGWRSGKEG
ncbi:hypothetical protein Droror1_Dr00022916 [Drosera rotundifolia]